VILGASSGFGLELGRQYSQKGFKVVLAARREKLLKEAVEDIKKKGGKNIEYCVTDACDEGSVKDLVDYTVKTFGGIDLAIYSAGISQHVIFENIKDLSKVYQIIMDVNFTGLVYFSYHCQGYLKKSKNGALCGISSILGEISVPYCTIYTAAKHAMNGFLESLSNEEPGFSVTICCPGYIKTEFDQKKSSW